MMKKNDEQALRNGLANVLMVDDSLGEIVLTKNLFEANDFVLNFFSVRDGADVLQFPPLASMVHPWPRPDLILLDINMPDIDGKDTLVGLKRHAALRRVPVIMLSGSDSSEDIELCMRLGAIDYMIKPIDFVKLQAVLTKLSQFIMVERNDTCYLYCRDSE